MFALSTTMEGDTTNFFIYRKLSAYPVKVTVIARGISVSQGRQRQADALAGEGAGQFSQGSAHGQDHHTDESNLIEQNSKEKADSSKEKEATP